MNEISDEHKLTLVRFVCSFAWADLEIADKERDFVRDLVAKLELDEEDTEQAFRWLDQPPREDELDPFDIPIEHARLFLSTVVEMVGADDILDRMEIETYQLFEELINEMRDVQEGDSPAE